MPLAAARRVTDAIHLASDNKETGWRVLPPGGEFRSWFEIHAGLILV